jgi:hypothetical protein
MSGEGLVKAGAQLAEAFTRALGRAVRHDAVTPEAFRAVGFRGAEELGNMFQFQRDFEAEVCAARSARAESRDADVRRLARSEQGAFPLTWRHRA